MRDYYNKIFDYTPGRWIHALIRVLQRRICRGLTRTLIRAELTIHFASQTVYSNELCYFLAVQSVDRNLADTQGPSQTQGNIPECIVAYTDVSLAISATSEEYLHRRSTVI